MAQVITHDWLVTIKFIHEIAYCSVEYLLLIWNLEVIVESKEEEKHIKEVVVFQLIMVLVDVY